MSGLGSPGDGRALSEQFAHRNVAVVAMLKALEPNPNLTGPPRRIAVMFRDMAAALLETIEVDSPMLTDGLRKLWEAKNSLVYASLERR